MKTLHLVEALRWLDVAITHLEGFDWQNRGIRIATEQNRMARDRLLRELEWRLRRSKRKRRVSAAFLGRFKGDREYGSEVTLHFEGVPVAGKSLPDFARAAGAV